MVEEDGAGLELGFNAILCVFFSLTKSNKDLKKKLCHLSTFKLIPPFIFTIILKTQNVVYTLKRVFLFCSLKEKIFKIFGPFQPFLFFKTYKYKKIIRLK